MIYPIVAFGHPVLKRKAKDVEVSQDLLAFIDDLYETMYAAKGVGLAAPQVGKGQRVFVVDGSPFAEDPENEVDSETLKTFKRAFINPVIVEESGEPWGFEEGCLSIPDIHANVIRHPNIVVHSVDEQGKPLVESFSGVPARIIQHEFDHIEGVLFTDRLQPLKKRLLKSKLNDIAKGNISTDYRMKFYLK